MTRVVNDAPYVQRIPDQGNSGVEEPIEPLECFMILEVDGHVGFQKMSAAVMAAKPKDVRHTIFTKYQLPMLEYMPTYVQQFAHELRSMPHLRNASLRTMGPIIDSLLADAGTRGTQIERNPKERLVLDKEGNTAGTKWYNDDDSAMTSKMGMEAPKPEQTDTESEGIQGEGNFEYKINYDIISTEDTYTMPPITMASGQLPHREAVMGSTTVRFSPAGVTKVFLPPKRDS